MQRVLKAERISTITAGEVSLDVSAVSVRSVITTDNRDRSQDIVVTDGIDLANHEINPVVLLEHEYAIGLARTPDGLYTVERHPGFLLGTTYFDQGNPLSIETFRCIDRGVLKGASIGFVVKHAEVILAEPGTVQVNVDMDGDRVTKEQFGIRYGRIELVEYSHTILPDNAEALTVAVQKSRLGGEAMSPTMKRLLSPYVIETPATVSVPEQIVEVKAMAEEYVDETPKEAPKEPEPEQQAAETAATDDLPPGARLLDGVYSRLLELAQYIEDEGGSKRQENPEILAFVEQMVPQLDEFCQSICSTHDGLYPDLDSLNKATDDGSTVEESEDEQEPEPEGKRVRRTLVKRIETYRKSRVGLKPVEVAPKPDDVSKEQYEQLVKQFERLEEKYEKLVKQFRAARVGR